MVSRMRSSVDEEDFFPKGELLIKGCKFEIQGDIFKKSTIIKLEENTPVIYDGVLDTRFLGDS